MLVSGFGPWGWNCEFDVSVSRRTWFSFTSIGVVGIAGSKRQLGLHRPRSEASESIAAGSPALPGTRAAVLA
jgi:hypothetical protein